MGTRRYELSRSGTPGASWRLDLDDDGTFSYGEEEAFAEYSVGADASGRWTANGTAISLEVTKSNFGSGRGAWLVGRTEEGFLEGDVVVLEGGALRLRR